jgi:hypothetical protein
MAVNELLEIIEKRHDKDIRELQRLCSERHDDRMRMLNEARKWHMKYTIAASVLFLTWFAILLYVLKGLG